MSQPRILLDTIAARGWSLPTGSVEQLDLSPSNLDSALRLALAVAGEDPGSELPRWRNGLLTEARRRMFPRRFPLPSRALAGVAEAFFPLARVVVGEQMAPGRESIVSRLPFQPLEEEETSRWPSGREYRQVVQHLEEEGFLVCLAMAQDWQHLSIFEHVLGVTGLALWIARGLSRVAAVDLPLLHGAAVGHDIGKFGCIGDEVTRIPRLHYYYTHDWYQTRNLASIGHIATNHSCWDLEQVRLPIETQILIYADFRSKDVRGPDGIGRMSIISLSEAFATIRGKLEGLDAEKLRRYQGVYRKLRDLEDYLLALGVRLDPPGFATRRPSKPALPKGLDITAVLSGRERADVVALASGREVASVCRFLATAHNLGVMERLRDLPALRDLLDEARSFEGLRDLRTYLGVLGEYSPALSMEQKELAIDFFFELLSHRDDDIRYHAANRIGDLLSLGEDFWRKDLPAGVTVDGGNWVLAQLQRVLGLLDMAGREAEEDMSSTERLVYAVPVVLRRLVTHAEPELARSVLSACFDHFQGRLGDHRPLVGLYVCEASEVLLHLMSHEQQLGLLELAQGWAHHEVDSTRLMAWRLLAGLAQAGAENETLWPGLRYCVDLLGRRVGPRMLVAEAFLLESIATRCGLSRVIDRCRDWLSRQSDPVQQVMLRNLKARVGWVEKKVNCDFLVTTALARRDGDRDAESHLANELAFHFANLLKVSRVEGTRFHAGRCLLQLAPALTVAQRNDLMVELLRSLQLDVEAVTRYIPRFLGSLLATLPQLEFAEALDDIESNAKSGGELPQRLLLQTAGWIVMTLDREHLDEKTLRRILGVMLAGLAETRASTAHEAFAQVSMVLDRLRRAPQGDDRAGRFLVLATKKLLTLVSHRDGDRGRFFLVASMLNHLERALTAARPRVHFPDHPVVAFIPGTYDPFTMAHSQVVSRALEHAHEALVQVDDYSWRKHAQPRERRKELAWMALASIPEAFPSPIEPPVNIANPTSLAALRRRIGRRSLLLVAGTDVIAGASAYRSSGSKIWDIPHLVVVREEFTGRKWQEKLGWFRAGVQVARVAPGMRTVSSSTLRGALSRQETLELYSDPLVARTLAERQLYVNFPSQKELVQPPDYVLETRRGRFTLPPGLRQLVHVEAPASPAWIRLRREACILRRHGATHPVATITWRQVAAAELPVVLSDQRLARLPEGQLFGLGALVDGVAVDPDVETAPVLQALLAKAIARFLDAGLLFALTAMPASENDILWKELEQCGVQLLAPPDLGQDRPGWVGVDLGDPLLLVLDMEETLQPRFAERPETRRMTEKGRRSIAEFFARRAPGHGLLHISEQQLKREIAALAVSRLTSEPRAWVVLGLGRRFSRDLVGERPTLAIELERFLTWEGYEAGVQPSPGSPALALQLDTARELGRDALLLAPFLDTPDAVQQVVAQAKVAGIRIREVLIGVTSASVHATLHLEGIPHRCGVIVPRWRGVVRESCLAPYLGGWSIQGRAPLQTGSLLPSLNDCLPYHHPHPLGLGGESALDFSRLVLDHTRNLLATLEELFRETEGRFLSLREMRAIVRTPRCPPFSLGIEPPRGRLPSSLLAEDLESLARLHPESHAAHRARWRSA